VRQIVVANKGTIVANDLTSGLLQIDIEIPIVHNRFQSRNDHPELISKPALA
jgi:hypothetical protein